jgi:hypothetical protein
MWFQKVFGNRLLRRWRREDGLPKCNVDVDSEYYCQKCDDMATWRTEVHGCNLPRVEAHSGSQYGPAVGVSVLVAMKITGHRTDLMFRRYPIVDEEQTREALVKTQAYLAASATRKTLVMKWKTRTLRAHSVAIE